MCSASTCVGIGKLLQLGVKKRLLCLTAFLLSYRYGHRRQATTEHVWHCMCFLNVQQPADDGLRGGMQHSSPCSTGCSGRDDMLACSIKLGVTRHAGTLSDSISFRQHK